MLVLKTIVTLILFNVTINNIVILCYIVELLAYKSVIYDKYSMNNIFHLSFIMLYFVSK